MRELSTSWSLTPTAIPQRQLLRSWWFASGNLGSTHSATLVSKLDRDAVSATHYVSDAASKSFSWENSVCLVGPKYRGNEFSSQIHHSFMIYGIIFIFR